MKFPSRYVQVPIGQFSAAKTDIKNLMTKYKGGNFQASQWLTTLRVLKKTQIVDRMVNYHI